MNRNAAPQAPPARGMEEMKKCSAGRCRDVLCNLDPLHKQATQRGTGRISGLLASGVACSLLPRSVPRRRQSPTGMIKIREVEVVVVDSYHCTLVNWITGPLRERQRWHGGVVAGSFGRKPQKSDGTKIQPTQN
eukprot:gene14345-biopygen565